MNRTNVFADVDDKFCKVLEVKLTRRGTYEVVGIASDGERTVQLKREKRRDILQTFLVDKNSKRGQLRIR